MFKKILVRMPNWIGDAVMATPTLSVLRDRFKKGEITLLAKPPVAALLEHHPDIDRIFIYEDQGKHAGIPGFFRLVRSLRKEKFDLAFLFQNAFEAALLAALAGIPERVGYAADGRRFLLTRSVPKRDAPVHQRDAYLYLMNFWGGPLKVGPQAKIYGVPLLAQDQERPPEARRPYLKVTEEEKRGALARLESHGISKDDLWVGINPGAAYGSSKRWAPARFAAVADRLVERHRAKVVIFGGPAEAGIAEQVAAEMKHPAVILAGKTSVREVMALVSRCRLFITNDSGPMHVASAFEVPLVAVFGPTNPAATSPAGRYDSVIQKKAACAPCTHRECPIDHRCMEEISVEAVLAEAEKQLKISSSAKDPNERRKSSLEETYVHGAHLHRERAATGPLYSRPAQSIQPEESLEEIKGSKERRKFSLEAILTEKKGAVFLDRDGTVNEDVGHMTSLERFALIPGAAAAIAKLNRRGIPVVLITNQSGVARGIFTERFVGEVHRHLQRVLAEQGGFLDAIYYCPHHPDFIPCQCRKPGLGMIEKALSEHPIDFSRSYIVGDKPLDMALAREGAKGVLVQTGYGKKSLQEMLESGKKPAHVAENLPGAVEWILGDMRERKRVDA